MRGVRRETIEEVPQDFFREHFVSVPLRGVRRETCPRCAAITANKYSWFPSPCGVLGVKLIDPQNNGAHLQLKFPSPCGVLGVKQFAELNIPLPAFIAVSVPLRGVRRETQGFSAEYVQQVLSFRPLAGC